MGEGEDRFSERQVGAQKHKFRFLSKHLKNFLESLTIFCKWLSQIRRKKSKRKVLGRRNSCAKLTFKTANSCFYESGALTQDGRSPNFYHLQPIGN